LILYKIGFKCPYGILSPFLTIAATGEKPVREFPPRKRHRSLRQNSRQVIFRRAFALSTSQGNAGDHLAPPNHHDRCGAAPAASPNLAMTPAAWSGSNIAASGESKNL
jgi:hypothetical protein